MNCLSIASPGLTHQLFVWVRGDVKQIRGNAEMVQKWMILMW